MSWELVEYFTPDEFKCRCGRCFSTGQEMDLRFVRRLNQLRKETGIPMVVTSGYRCPAHNNNVSSTGHDGPHTTGRAADIAVSGEAAHKLVIQSNFSGLGINQRGAYDQRFIHLDDLEGPTRPRVWTY